MSGDSYSSEVDRLTRTPLRSLSSSPKLTPFRPPSHRSHASRDSHLRSHASSPSVMLSRQPSHASFRVASRASAEAAVDISWLGDFVMGVAHVAT